LVQAGQKQPDLLRPAWLSRMAQGPELSHGPHLIARLIRIAGFASNLRWSMRPHWWAATTGSQGTHVLVRLRLHRPRFCKAERRMVFGVEAARRHLPHSAPP
jgi:hypothetical protein